MSAKLRSLLAGCAAGALVAGAAPAAAQQANAWNTDGRSGVSQAEWQSGLNRNGLYDRLDRDGNNEISQDEFAAGVSGPYDYNPQAEIEVRSDRATLYERWDSDGDGALSEGELSAGSYASFDSNANGRIDTPEFPRIGTQGAGRDVPSLQGRRGGGGVGAAGDVGVDGDIGGSSNGGGGVGSGTGVRGGGGVSIDPEI